MLKLIDTHSHLFLEQFDSDRKETLERAFNNGVSKILLPNVDNKTINSLLSLCDSYPQNCFPMIGLHPVSVKEDYLKEMKKIEEWLQKREFIAIGEIGIDLYWDKTFINEQIEIFERQIDLALEYKLPIVIHSRKSFDEIFTIMDKKNNDNLKGIFHSFSGNDGHAKKIISYGFKLGIGGVVTFKNSGLDKVIKDIDIEHIVLETDSPYLTPMPHRGKRNESSYIINIAQKIAEIKEISINEVAEITTANSIKVFNLP